MIDRPDNDLQRLYFNPEIFPKTLFSGEKLYSIAWLSLRLLLICYLDTRLCSRYECRSINCDVFCTIYSGILWKSNKPTLESPPPPALIVLPKCKVDQKLRGNMCNAVKVISWACLSKYVKLVSPLSVYENYLMIIQGLDYFSALLAQWEPRGFFVLHHLFS